jgi:glycosyltransferase involved in cell wall biosynthesis
MLKISIVVPLYNKEKHIKRAIDSVFAQTIQDFELIVIDDGSTDKSAQVVKEIKDYRVRLIRQVNQGEGAARNRGIDEARFDLVAFLDADDAWKPQFLETILSLRNKYPNAGAYVTAYEIIGKNGDLIKRRYLGIPHTKWDGIIPNYFRSAVGGSPVFSSSVAIPKYVFACVGNFPVGEKLAGVDLDMWLRIALKYPIVFSTYVCATYFRNAENRIDIGNFYLSEYRLVKNARDALLRQKLSFKVRFYLNEYKNIFQLKTASHCLLTDDKQMARIYLKDCVTIRYLPRKVLFLCLLYFPTSFAVWLWNIKKLYRIGYSKEY